MANKIIFVSTFLPPSNPGVTNEHFLEGKLRREIFHWGWSWTFRFSEYLKKMRPDYEIECWNCYSPLEYDDLGIYKKFEDGRLFIQFPVTKIGGRNIPLSLLKEFQRRISNGEKFIAHYQILNNVFSNIFPLLFPSVKHITQQRGGDFPPKWKYRFRKKSRFLFENLFYYLTHRKFSKIITSSLGGLRYNIKKVGHNKVLYCKGGGFDFDLHKPKPKVEMRKELGLPLEKKIMIFVGKFETWRNEDKFGLGSGKGLGNSIECYKHLKEKHKDVEMIFLGGRKTKNQNLYDAVVDSGGILKKYMPNKEVIRYINASDVLLLPTEDKEWIPFGDIPTCVVESLAVNTPVISPMLIHFSGTKVEREKLGIVTHNLNEVIEAVKYIFSNPEKYSNTREIVKKYYSWDKIITKNSEVYDKIFREINE